MVQGSSRTGVVAPIRQRYYVGWNRGVIRRPVWFAAGALIVLTILDWPGIWISLLNVVVALALVGAGLWAQITFPEPVPEGVSPTGEPVEAETQQPD